jgi:hypothetical protein
MGQRKLLAQVKRMCITYDIVCILLTWEHRTIVEDGIEAIISRGEGRAETCSFQGIFQILC